jgi:hypothetical protein
MAIKHAQTGEVIDVRALGEALTDHKTHALAKGGAAGYRRPTAVAHKVDRVEPRV